MEKILDVVEFAPIPGYTKYVIDRVGIVFNGKTGKQIKPYTNKGYDNVVLCENNIVKTHKVHRLMMYAWVGVNQDMHVNHKDCNKLNNAIENLEYCTPLENMQHAFANGHYRRNIVQCTQTGTIYDSIKLASEAVGMKRETLSRQLHGKKPNNTTLKIIKYAARA